MIIAALAMLTMAGSAMAQGHPGYYGPNYTPHYAPMGTHEEGTVNYMAIFGMDVTNFRNLASGYDMDPKVGFTMGVRAEYTLPACRGLFANVGLEYTMKGARDRVKSLSTADDILGVGATMICRPMYLQVPIHVGYYYEAMENVGVYGDFGPYFALGIHGKTRYKMDDYSADKTHRFFCDNNGFLDVKRVDFGLGYRVGVEYADHYNLVLGMDWGITDMLTRSQKHTLYNAGYDFTMKNFCASLTFGYRF